MLASKIGPPTWRNWTNLCCPASIFYNPSYRSILRSKYDHSFKCINQFSLIIFYYLTIVAEVNSNTYWRTPFNALSGTKQLTEYVVMDIEIIRDHEKRTFAGQGAMSYKVFSYKLSLISHK